MSRAIRRLDKKQGERAFFGPNNCLAADRARDGEMSIIFAPFSGMLRKSVAKGEEAAKGPSIKDVCKEGELQVGSAGAQ